MKISPDHELSVKLLDFIEQYLDEHALDQRSVETSALVLGGLTIALASVVVGAVTQAGDEHVLAKLRQVISEMRMQELRAPAMPEGGLPS